MGGSVKGRKENGTPNNLLVELGVVRINDSENIIAD
jgi:hypothetical protein